MTTPDDIYARVPDFLRAIDQMTDPSDHGERQQLMRRFKTEAFLLSLSLNEIGLTGCATDEVVPIGHCDLCDDGFDGLFVDGNTNGGWANMCPTCFATHGKGLGWGIGQMYRAQVNQAGDVRWICIAGGNTSPEILEEE